MSFGVENLKHQRFSTFGETLYGLTVLYMAIPREVDCSYFKKVTNRKIYIGKFYDKIMKVELNLTYERNSVGQKKLSVDKNTLPTDWSDEYRVLLQAYEDVMDKAGSLGERLECDGKLVLIIKTP